MALLHPGESPCSQHPDDQDAGSLSLGPLYQTAEILKVESWSHRCSGTGVDQVVARLGAENGARINDPQQRFGLTEPSDAIEANLSLGLQSLKTANYLAQDVLHAQQIPVWIPQRSHPVMELDQVHRGPVHTSQAVFHGFDDARLDVPHVLWTQANFSPYVDVS